MQSSLKSILNNLRGMPVHAPQAHATHPEIGAKRLVAVAPAGEASSDDPQDAEAVAAAAKVAAQAASAKKRQLAIAVGAVVIAGVVWVALRPKAPEGAFIDSPILTSAPALATPSPITARPVAVIEASRRPEPAPTQAKTMLPDVAATNPASAVVQVALSDVPLGNEVTMDRVGNVVNDRMQPLLTRIDEMNRTVAGLEQKLHQLNDKFEERRQQLGDGEMPAHKVLFTRYELLDDPMRGAVEARIHYSKTDDDPVFWNVKTNESGQMVTVEVFDAVITARPPPPVAFLTGVNTRLEGTKRRFVFESSEQIDADVALNQKYLSIVLSPIDKSAGLGVPARDVRPLLASDPESPAFEDERSPSEIDIARAWKVKAISPHSAVLYNTRLNRELSVALGQEVPYSGRVTDLRETTNEVVTERDVLTKLKGT